MQNTELMNLIGKTVTSMGYEFVGLEQTMGKPMVLKIYIDGLGGINLDTLAKVSRQIGTMLDVEAFTEARYMLEVSSPGIERPLFTLEHFNAQIGKKISIKLNSPINTRRKLLGTLVKVVGDIIYIEEDPSIIEVEFNNISKAKLVCDDLIKIGKGKKHE